MDKVKDMIAQALVKYLGDRPAKKKTKKKAAPTQEKKPDISVSQTVNVGHPSPMNEADVALGRMRIKPDYSALRKY